MSVMEIGILSTLVGALIWYLKHQTRQQTKREDKHDEEQKDERQFYRNLVTNDLKDLHKNGESNLMINKEIAEIQGRILVSMERHEEKALQRDKKQLEILKNALNLSNGGNPVIRKALKDIDEIFKIIRDDK